MKSRNTLKSSLNLVLEASSTLIESVHSLTHSLTQSLTHSLKQAMLAKEQRKVLTKVVEDYWHHKMQLVRDTRLLHMALLT